MKVGFIGLGRMGSGMARNLLRAGHEVTVYNRTPGRSQALSADGARVAESVAEACRVEALITMLANDDAVKEVVLGPEGIVSHLQPGALHISSSTISVALARRLAEDSVGARSGVADR
jgi:3-hydroxyisobutyrate dehydrogenase-like beta-hydroxyacid dehydrogenase